MMYSITTKLSDDQQPDHSTARWKPTTSVSGKDVGREGNDTCKQAAQYVTGKRKLRTELEETHPQVTHLHHASSQL